MSVVAPAAYKERMKKIPAMPVTQLPGNRYKPQEPMGQPWAVWLMITHEPRPLTPITDS